MSDKSTPYSQLDRRLHVHSFTDLDQYQRDGALVVDHGEGIYLVDTEGRRYLDAMASLWCVTLGYDESRLVEAAHRQLEKLPFSHTFRGRSHPVLIELAETLVGLAPEQMTRVFFAGSGSEANESAVKMTWAYHAQRGEPQRRKIISRQNAYHGSTIFASQLCGMPSMHAQLETEHNGILFADAPHFATGARAGESESEFCQRLIQQLEEMIEREGANMIAAMIAEPVMAVGGVIVPPAGYFEGVCELLKRHGILLIADEVVCGLGRTGDWFGSLSLGMQPDVMTLAKGITSAYFPLSTVIMSEPVYQALQANSATQGVFSHGFTYSGHPVGAAIALEVLNILLQRDIPGHVRRVGERFQAGIRALTKFDSICHPRGIGLMAAFDLCADVESGKRFTPEIRAGNRLMDIAEQQGLLIRAVGDSIVLAPPLIIDEAEVDELIKRLESSIDIWSTELCH